MDSAQEQQINHLISEIKKLKEAQLIAENNVVNLIVRSEITVAIISAMIADGVIQRDGVVEFVKNAEINIPGFSETVEGARASILKLLDSAKIAE